MYKLTLTTLKYGYLSSCEDYYAKDDEQLAEIKHHLFHKHDIYQALFLEYSIHDTKCTSTDRWDSVYWSFEEDSEEAPKWGYTLKIKLIKFGI